jgi:TonB family protein
MLSSHLDKVRFASRHRVALLLIGLSIPGYPGALATAATPVDLAEVRDRVLYAPEREFYRAWVQDSWCSAVMVVDPVSGKVTRVYIEDSSGHDYLNHLAVEMLRGWKFKPGSPPLVRVRFGMTPVWRDTEPVRRAQPLNKVLEPSLGRDALVKGALPEYPRTKPWTKKHGTGVFDLHVDREGHVTNVTVKKSSGDATFDEVTARAIRGWRFRRGPIEIELPLYFALTPESFAVRIPKYP